MQSGESTLKLRNETQVRFHRRQGYSRQILIFQALAPLIVQFWVCHGSDTESSGVKQILSDVMTPFSKIVDSYLAKEGADRFSLPALQKKLMEAPTWRTQMKNIDRMRLPEGIRTSLERGLICWAFLAQVVEEPAINTTRYRSRWSSRLKGDPRFSSPEGAELFFKKSIEVLVSNFNSPTAKKDLIALLEQTLIPAEIPLDYASKTIRPIHVAENITSIDLKLLDTTVKLRAMFNDSSNEINKVMKKVYDKVQVKSYLTDRVLTGSYKTNREYRWEVSPDSVHFAFKRNCMQIESSLVLAVINMEGFPEALRKNLNTSAGIDISNTRTTCPITLEELSFEKFSGELLNPVPGKSSFQVGHLNPLKNVGTHVADNIAWVSEEGNRIQGDNTLDETRLLLKRIFDSYKRARII